MKFLVGLADRVGSILAALASVGVVLMMLHICGDVVLRAISGRPLPATVEIVSRYYMVLIAFLPLAWVERRNGMVSVELTDWMMSPGAKRLSDLSVALIACGLYLLMTWTTWESAMKNYASGTFVIALNSKISVWPSYFLPPIGFGLAALVTLIRAGQILNREATTA